MPSLQAKAIKIFSRLVIRRRRFRGAALVKHLRRVLDNAPVLRRLPRGVSFEHRRTQGFQGDRVFVTAPTLTMLYLHGGAYASGKVRTYHNMAGYLASSLHAEVFLLTYPLAPEHPFPAAVDSCFAAYRSLLDGGASPHNIVIAGDSAGGGLTLALLLKLRDEGLPLPRCSIAISPGARASGEGESVMKNRASDAMLSPEMIRGAIELYTPNISDRSNPYASPCLGDYEGLPPLMITVGTDECLYSDAMDVRARAEAAGVRVEWVERAGLFHVWPILIPLLPEAEETLARMVTFIEDCAPTPEES